MKNWKGTNASITLECALVLPLFTFFVLLVAYLSTYARVSNLVQSSITQGSIWSARNAYIETLKNNAAIRTGESLISSVNNNSILKEKAGDDFLSHSGIKGGATGVVMLTDALSDKHNVRTSAAYSYELPFNVFGLGSFHTLQSAISRKWTGYDPTENEIGEETVYVTENGRVYHRDINCSYIKIVTSLVTQAELSGLRNKSDGRYHPCERCIKKNGSVSSYYITAYGSSYHSDPACSSLKRSLKAIPISQVGEKGPCSKCGSRSHRG